MGKKYERKPFYNTDCFAFGGVRCKALKDFYNEGKDRCRNCPFYKSQDKYDEEFQLYMLKALSEKRERSKQLERAMTAEYNAFIKRTTMRKEA